MPANILNLPCYKVLGIQENEHDYHIDVETLEAPTSCPHCQSANLVGFGSREQMVKDLPMHGRRVGLYIDTRRYRCRNCGKTFYEALPEIDEKRLMALNESGDEVMDDNRIGAILIRPRGYNSTEISAAIKYCAVSDTRMDSIDADRIGDYLIQLKSALAVPIGSVEFVQRAMQTAGIKEPANNTYPIALRPFLKRKVWQCRVGEVAPPCFVKPVPVKRFTGFVFEDKPASPDAVIQKDIFMTLSSNEQVWCSDVVEWGSEWRVYVCHGVVVGMGRYDDGADDAPQPDRSVIDAMVAALEASQEAVSAYALDVGVLRSGETALVEFNDAWALGLYRGTLSEPYYFRMLAVRWSQIAAQLECAGLSP